MIINYSEIDEPMRVIVKLLNNNGFVTTASCQGGKGHAFPLPRIMFGAFLRFEGPMIEFLRSKGIGNFSFHSVADYGMKDVIKIHSYIEFMHIEDCRVKYNLGPWKKGKTTKFELPNFADMEKRAMAIMAQQIKENYENALRACIENPDYELTESEKTAVAIEGGLSFDVGRIQDSVTFTVPDYTVRFDAIESKFIVTQLQRKK